MIDIHHHCLPGIDDGPRALSDAVDLCRMAADEGIETIVATPHVLRGRWVNTAHAQLQSLIEALRVEIGDAPRLLLGSEYFFGHDMDEVLRRGDAIVPLAGSRYVLVEFASHSIPPLVTQPFYRAQLDGWIPIIAHPERNSVFQAKPEVLLSLLRIGVKTQVTTGSLTGKFGPEAEQAAAAWLSAGWVHFMATDAHNCEKRPPRFVEARSRVVEICGEETAQALFVENPKAIVERRGLVYDPDLPDESGVRTGAFTRLRKLFKR